MQFRNQPVKDILVVLSEIADKTIVPDDTVTGNASYTFRNIPFDQALEQFLESQNLYSTYKDNTFFISNIQSSYSPDSGIIFLKTENEDIGKIIKHISRLAGITILYDSLPKENISIQFNEGDLDSLLNILIMKFSDYSLESDKHYYYIKSKPDEDKAGTRPAGGYFSKSNNLYTVNLERAGFKDLFQDLMRQEGFEYSYLGKDNSVIEDFSFSDKPFEMMLNLLMEQGNSSYQLINDIYYIFDSSKQDILDKFYSTVLYELKNISASAVTSLIPSILLNDVSIKPETDYNAVLISGTLIEVEKLKTYLSGIDVINPEYSWYRFDLNFIESESISSLLPDTYSHYKKIIMSDRDSFLMSLREEKVQELRKYIKLIDIPKESRPITLNYISGEEFIEKLPPLIDEDEIYESLDQNILYFTGNEDKWKLLQQDLEFIDKPKSQIRYEILVFQVQETNQLDMGLSFSSDESEDGDSSILTGSLGEVLNLNFNILAQFGYLFTANLNLALENSDARILVDTTLYGLSGEEISFQNTNTSRFQELEYDDDGDLIDEGSIREITSGLTIEINGWVSGDKMITMEISATISKEDDSDSSSTSSLPSTTEKIISTQVRTPSGKPLIISGLKQRDTTMTISKTPILGDIPLIGHLFQTRNETYENTDFYITVVPYLEKVMPLERKDIFENIYNKLVRDYDQEN